jgi:NADH:ubiquinone reductase (H+-translocating)
MSCPDVTTAHGGTLVLGGGFGGAYVARLLGKRGATIVTPESSMLYTPLLAEVAAGAIEPRHVAVPLRMMCPHADLVLGRAIHLDESARRVSVETDLGHTVVEYERLVVAVGAVARMLPIPGLADRGLGFKNLADAVILRNHILGKLDAAEADPANAERHLTFVFVGAGFAGVEALAEQMDLVGDATRHYPRLKEVPQRWVLVNAGPKILAEVPERLGDYAAHRLRKRGVDIRVSTTLDCVQENGVRLSDGTHLDTNTLVWTAGVKPNPLVERLGLPLDEHGRVQVDSSLRVVGSDNVWALGDCAAVPNEATPDKPDPPTCQHALRQARRLAKNLVGEARPYRYRSLGQAATLGRDRGIATALGLNMRGLPGSVFARSYHLYQLPLRSRRLRVLADGLLSQMFTRDIAQLGLLQRSLPQASATEESPAHVLA